MVLAIFLAFGFVAIAVVGKTLVMTLDAYPQLPQEVPYHFDQYGNVNSTGAKPMIFAMVVGQSIALVVWGIVATVIVLSPPRPTPLIGVGLVVSGICVALFDAQRSILDVALGKTERLAHQWRPLWIILPCVAIGVTIGVIFGR